MKHIQNQEEMFRLLQRELWKCESISSLSKNTGISTSTLYKYRRVGYNYPWPRYNTWKSLLPALGLTLELKKVKE